MFSIVAKWKVWYARFQLETAIREEEELRTAATELRRITIPKLERALETAEIGLELSRFIEGGRK